MLSAVFPGSEQYCVLSCHCAVIIVIQFESDRAVTLEWTFTTTTTTTTTTTVYIVQAHIAHYSFIIFACYLTENVAWQISWKWI